MKINIGNHEFTELWDGVLYKALSDYPNVSDNGTFRKCNFYFEMWFFTICCQCKETSRLGTDW